MLSWSYRRLNNGSQEGPLCLPPLSHQVIQSFIHSFLCVMRSAGLWKYTGELPPPELWGYNQGSKTAQIGWLRLELLDLRSPPGVLMSWWSENGGSESYIYLDIFKISEIKWVI